MGIESNVVICQTASQAISYLIFRAGNLKNDSTHVMQWEKQARASSEHFGLACNI